MIFLNKNASKYELGTTKSVLASVCSSCACGGGVGSCNTTCKGCKDKNYNVKTVKSVYNK